MSFNPYTARQQLVEMGRRVYERGYVAANDGNLSVRLPDGRIMITPTGVSKGYMTAESMVICGPDGGQLSGGPKPSSEIGMHLTVYRERPEIHAIVHAHPPYATAFGISGIPLSQAILPEVIITLGAVPLVEYGTPGTEELSIPLLKYIQKYDAFILQNHGALTIGPDLTAACYRMETVEHFAHIAFIAYMLGRINTLAQPDIAKLLTQRARYGFAGQFQPVQCTDDSGACSILTPDQTILEPVTDTTGSTVSTSQTPPGQSPLTEDLIRELAGRVVKDLLDRNTGAGGY